MMRETSLKILKITALIVLAVTTLFPFFIMFKSSFEPYERIVSLDFNLFPQSWTYIENYKNVILNYPLVRWFSNSLVVTVVTIAANVVFCVPAGYALARLNFPGKKVVFVLVLCTIMIPIQVIVIPLYLMVVKLNWVDSYWGLIVPQVVSPFGIFLLRQSFMQLPYELDEAALIDGASRLRTLVAILIPNTMPAIGTFIVLKFMWVWGDFLWPSLVIKSDLLRTLPIGIATLQRQGGTVPWELVMPSSVITIIPIVALFLFFQRYFIKGLTEGSVKG